MKYIISFIVFTGINSFQDKKEMYITVMLENISLIDSTSSITDYYTAANGFERISKVTVSEWLPLYYCSFCYVQMSFLVKDKDKRDEYVETARFFLGEAESLSPDNAEIYVLKGFILQAYMNIEPFSRGVKYNSECISYFKKASELDPANPRSYLWHGVQLINIPSFMGGGQDKGLSLIKKAVECFISFIPESKISPDWGYDYALKMVDEISLCESRK